MSVQHPLIAGKLCVSEAQNGLFALGHSSHFGLGRFQPIMSSCVAQLDESDSDPSTHNQPTV